MWIQNYFAVGNNVFLTALCAAIPFIFLFWALAIKKMKGHLAILIAWHLIMMVALIVYRMPFTAALSAAAFGALQGVFILCWLVLNSVFLCNLIRASGNFDIITSSIASISRDRRIQAILIAFCFSAFLEGTTGVAAPVAIGATMLIGLGFPAFTAIIVCLVGNTFPVPFGSIGLPTVTTVNAAFPGIEGSFLAVASSVGGIMSAFAIITPFFILIIMSGWKATKEVIPLCLVAGLSYAIPNFIVARYMGPELPSLVAPIISLGAVIVFLKFWKPQTTWLFNGDALPAWISNYIRPASSGKKILYAWTPFIMVILFIIAWSQPAFRAFAATLPFIVTIDPWPGLHGIVYQAAPIVAEPAIFTAIFNFNVFTSGGTALLIVSLLTALLFRIKPFDFLKVLAATFNQIKFALLTMILVFSIAQISNYSGLSFTLGLALAATRSLFIVFSPLVGFMGIFLTGTVTATGALFASLQRVTAEQLGLNPIITITANITGAVVGKLISLQSISLAAAAAGLVGQEGLIFSKLLKPALLLLGISVILIVILAHIFPGYFPELNY